jgi:hypothetical protein
MKQSICKDITVMTNLKSNLDKEGIEHGGGMNDGDQKLNKVIRGPSIDEALTGNVRYRGN